VQMHFAIASISDADESSKCANSIEYASKFSGQNST
jgi:hypothetical protein